MALQPCPECGHQISEKATTCPHCGAPLLASPPPVLVVKSKSNPWVIGAIVVLLVIIAIPVLGSILQALFRASAEAKPSAKATVTQSNAKQVLIAIHMYAGDYYDYLPPLHDRENLKQLVYPYLHTNDVWETSNPNGGTLLVNPNLSCESLTNIVDLENTVILYDSKDWPAGMGRCYGFADGSSRMERDPKNLSWGLPGRDAIPSGFYDAN